MRLAPGLLARLVRLAPGLLARLVRVASGVLARSVRLASGQLARALVAAAIGPSLAVATAATPEGAVAELVAFEEAARARTDWSSPRWRRGALGPDPFALVAAGGDPPRWIGALRGADAVVLLDDRGHEIDRAAAPASTTGLALLPDGTVAAVGEASAEIALFRRRGDALERTRSLRLAGVLGLRGVAAAGRRLVVLDAIAGRVLEVDPAADPPRARSLAVCAGPVAIAAAGESAVASCLLEHSLLVLDESGRERARIVHDGPLWSVAALREDDGALLIAAGGVEDRPLDRRDGSFGYIDSFAYVYRVAAGGEIVERAERNGVRGSRSEPDEPDEPEGGRGSRNERNERIGRDVGYGSERERDGGRGSDSERGGTGARAERLAQVNLSDRGVVTPKWLGLARGRGGEVTLAVSGYGGAALVTLAWAGADFATPPTIAQRPLPPGTTSIASGIAADPLLDAWIVLEDDRWRAVPVATRAATPAARSLESRVGEALFFTTLMAPWNESDGRRSRFTCETCHHEGYVDGRTHYTGRGDVFATTKPLVGLHGNRPYFSRALDPTMGRMVQNEFRVANRGSGRDPWFSLVAAEHPWLRAVDGVPEKLEPSFLRRALMAFLMDLDHTPNPATRTRTTYSALERRGAAAFRDLCESCHAARLVSDEPSSRLPFEDWEKGVFASAPIVWGRSGYEKTGVVPYVHPDGARVPSLRRLYKKRPYFTNGSARSLDDVLSRILVAEGAFAHDGELPSGRRLPAGERTALRAFLGLL